jgi:hypothetical protein
MDHFRIVNEAMGTLTRRSFSASLTALPIIGFFSRGVLAAPATSEPVPKGVRVFTCGHSFHVWVVPILSELARNAGIADHQVAGVSSIGGSMVQKHWDVADEKNLAKPALRDGKVDVLTLSPIWLPDEGIEKFATLAVQHNPEVRVTVQEYWMPNDEYVPVYPLQTKKKVDHNATDLSELRKAQAQYDHDIEEHVKALNQKLGKEVIFIVPVGRAVVELREKVAAGQVPDIKTQAELFRDSWGHPNDVIKALSGYCHFAVIYRRSPVGLPKPSILSTKPAWEDGSFNRLLQQLAWDAVTKEPMSGLNE